MLSLPAPPRSAPARTPAGLETAAHRRAPRQSSGRRRSQHPGAPGRHRQPLGAVRRGEPAPDPVNDPGLTIPRPAHGPGHNSSWSHPRDRKCARTTLAPHVTRVRPPRPEISRSDRGLPDGRHAPRSACGPTVSVSHRGTPPPCDWKRNSAPPIETQTQFAAAKISDSWTRRSLPLTCIGCICIGCTWRCLAVYPRRLSDPLSCCHPTFSSCHGRHQTGT